LGSGKKNTASRMLKRHFKSGVRRGQEYRAAVAGHRRHRENPSTKERHSDGWGESPGHTGGGETGPSRCKKAGRRLGTSDSERRRGVLAKFKTSRGTGPLALRDERLRGKRNIGWVEGTNQEQNSVFNGGPFS